MTTDEIDQMHIVTDDMLDAMVFAELQRRRAQELAKGVAIGSLITFAAVLIAWWVS